MFVLGISEGLTITMWIVNLAISAGITVVLARVASWQRRFDRQEDTYRADTRSLREDMEEKSKQLHEANVKLIDERFRAVTHQVNNHANNVSLALDEVKERIKAGEMDLDGLGDRDQKIELAVAQKVDQLKDYIRENTAQSGDLEKHEKAVDRKLENIEQRVIRIGEDVAVLKSASGGSKRGGG